MKKTANLFKRILPLLDSGKTAIPLAALLLLSFSETAGAQGTAFTYQGRLENGGNPVTGLYDFTNALYNSSSGGAQVGSTITLTAVPVTNGLFTILLDFDGVFNGTAYWLQIGVRSNGVGSYVALSPRQPVTPTPYAITAENLVGTVLASQLTGTLPSGLLSGLYGNALNFNNAANSFTGNGAGLTGVNATTLNGLTAANFWQLTGNAGTTQGANFVGTTDNQPLEIWVNGQRAFRLEPTTNSPNVIGGFKGNYVHDYAVGVTISGGGADSMTNLVELGSSASAFDVGKPDFGTIGGGGGNFIQTGSYATIGGGARNQIDSNNHVLPISYASIGGGASNFIGYVKGGTIAGGVANFILGDNTGGGWANYAAIGGGNRNGIVDGAWYTANSTIAGGSGNYIRSGDSCSIGGGIGNGIGGAPIFACTISGGQSNGITGSSQATIAGGNNNQVSAYGATISGGQSNQINGIYGTIPGGANNLATNYAFAAGNRAKAYSPGMFVWADSQNTSDFNPNLYGFYDNSFDVRVSGGILFTTGAGGANQSITWTAGAGSWSFTSDRNAKNRFEPVDVQSVLEKVSQLPLAEWSYKGYDQRHIGPVAQDFHSLFPLNDDDKTLNDVDLHGVALAAIQGLNQKVNEKDAEIQSLKQKNDSLSERLNELEAAVKALAARR